MDIKEFANTIEEEGYTSIFDENDINEMATEGPQAEKEYNEYKKAGGKRNFESFLKKVVDIVSTQNGSIKSGKQLADYEQMKPGMKRAGLSMKNFNKDIEE